MISRKDLTKEDVKKINELRELNDEDLDKVDGGYLFRNHDTLKWEIINDATGDVIDSCMFYNDAKYIAGIYHQSTEIIEWDTLKEIREKAKK